jgi:hypothetical protein
MTSDRLARRLEGRGLRLEIEGNRKTRELVEASGGTMISLESLDLTCASEAAARSSAIQGDGKGWPEPAHSQLSVEERFCGAPVARITVIR